MRVSLYRSYRQGLRIIGCVDKVYPEDWQVDAFVGSNPKYYKNKWKEHPGKHYGGWNWVPFFFGLEWLAYRKMYKQAIIAFLIALVINLILIFSPLHLDIDGKLFSDTINIFFAFFGNGMYRKKLMANLKKTKDIKQAQQVLILKKKGGVSFISLVICLLFEAGLLVMMFM